MTLAQANMADNNVRLVTSTTTSAKDTTTTTTTSSTTTSSASTPLTKKTPKRQLTPLGQQPAKDQATEEQSGYGGRPPSRPANKRPAHKLSVGLIDTYNYINKVYYEKKKLKKYNNGWDDEHYDYKITAGEMLADRYELKQRIGKGSFGQVVRCWDHKKGMEVAVKIIKSKKPFMVQAQTEIKLLELLEENDPQGQSQTVRMMHHFIFRNHQCIVFEMLYCNLYELLRNTNFKGISLNLIRKFARQILRTLAFLSQLPDPVIHCDLKPENILLCHPRKSAIKVIDFGSACKQTEKMYSYIQSRFYRAPEVLMGLLYNTAIDMWSLGCVLVEMHTGEPLFAGKSTHDQMGKIVEVFGLPPKEMISKAPTKQRGVMFEVVTHSADSVEATYRFRPVPQKSKSKSSSSGGADSSSSSASELSAVAVVPRGRHLHVILGRDTGGPAGRRRGEVGHGAKEYGLFIDLLERMLHYDPVKRISPWEALNHEFLFTGNCGSGTTSTSTSTSSTTGAAAAAAGSAASSSTTATAAAVSGGESQKEESATAQDEPESMNSQDESESAKLSTSKSQRSVDMNVDTKQGRPASASS